MRDIPSGKTYRVNLSSAPANNQATGFSSTNSPSAWISGDGQHVAFVEDATNLVAGDTNESRDVFVRDLDAANSASGVTERVSVSTSGAQGYGDTGDTANYISMDGSIIVFHSASNNLVPGDTNGFKDIFVRDRNAGTTTRVNLSATGQQANYGTDDPGSPAISSDGNLIVFRSLATNLSTPPSDCYTVNKDGTGIRTVPLNSSGQLFNPGNFTIARPTDRYVAFVNTADGSNFRGFLVDRSALIVSDAKQQPDNAPVIVSAGVVSTIFTDGFYIQQDGISSPARASGVRVAWTGEAIAGKRYIVTGTMKTTSDGERYVDAIAVDPLTSNWNVSVQPLGMVNKAIGGGDWHYNSGTKAGQMGVTGGVGLNNIGLLVRTTGSMTYIDDHTFTVDDGSGAVVTCVTPPTIVVNPAWQYVAVTGISSIKNTGSAYTRLLNVTGIDPMVSRTSEGITGRWEATSTSGATTGVFGLLLVQHGATVTGNSLGYPITAGQVTGNLFTGTMTTLDNKVYTWSLTIAGDTLAGTCTDVTEGQVFQFAFHRLSPNPISPYVGRPQVLAATCSGSSIDVTWDRPIMGWDYDVLDDSGHSLVTTWDLDTFYDPATKTYRIMLPTSIHFTPGKHYTICLGSDEVFWHDPYGVPAWNNPSDIYRFDYTAPAATDKRGVDGSIVSLQNMVVTAYFDDCFYVETQNRTWGIRVDGPYTVPTSIGVSFTGTPILATTPDGERCIRGATIVPGSPVTPIRPLEMLNKSLGGGNLAYDAPSGAGQMGVTGGVGLNNIGMLVRTTGKCSYVGIHTFAIDDGSGAPITCETPPTMVANPDWRYVAVTGISSIRQTGSTYTRLLKVTGVDPMVSVASQGVTGRWDTNLTSGDPAGDFGMLLTQTQNTVNGTMQGWTITAGQVSGNLLTYTFEVDNSTTVHSELTLSGDTLTGTWTEASGAWVIPVTFQRLSPAPVSPYIGRPQVVSATCDGTSIDVTWDRPINGWDFKIGNLQGDDWADRANFSYNPATNTYHMAMLPTIPLFPGTQYTVSLDSGSSDDWHDPYGAGAWATTANAYSFVFTMPGTPPSDDAAIRAVYASMKTALEAHNSGAVIALMAPDFIHDGTDRDTQQSYMAEGIAHVTAVDYEITNIAITGNTASVTASFTVTFDNQPPISWTEPFIGGGLGMGWMIKEDGAWLIYGDHIRGNVGLSTWRSTDGTYSLRASASGAGLNSVTVQGPSTPVTTMDWDSEWDEFATSIFPSQTPQVGDVYTFYLTYRDGSHETLTDTVKSLVPVSPTLTATFQNNTIAFSWDDISAQVPNAAYYWIHVHGPDRYAWSSPDYSLSTTSATLNEDGSATGTLQPGGTYGCTLFIDDSYGDHAQSYVNVTIPINDEDTIRALFASMKSTVEAHDLSGFMALFSTAFMHAGLDKSQVQADLAPSLNAIQTLDYSITSISITGNKAIVNANMSCTYNDGEEPSYWTEPDPTDNSYGLGWLVKQDNKWLVLGQQSTGVPPSSIEMINIPAGSFFMGNSNVGDDAYYRNNYPNELPQHSVYLSAYSISKYEITRGQYRAFLSDGGYYNPIYWSTEGWGYRGLGSGGSWDSWPAVQDWGTGSFTQTEDSPIACLTYYEAEAFCKWAGGHLPTEAQWEKAARWTGTHPNVYPWGDTWDVQKSNNKLDTIYPGYRSAPVGSYPAGASPSGCQDMCGNEQEWCQDWYGSTYYSVSPASDPQGPATGTNRVLRGGSYYDYSNVLRTAYRWSNGPGWASFVYGFRMAR